MIGILALILFALMMVIGGDRGAVSVMSLVGNILVLSLAIILMAGGHSPVLLTGIAAGVINYITLLKQNGKNLKTKVAFLVTGVVMLLLFAAIFLLLWDARSGGLNEIQAIQEDVMYYYNTNLHINMLQITVCMVLLSTLGAVLDTALSITSSLHEVILHKPDMSRREMYHSGLQIGKDIIGTTVNTLFFAYLGDSLLLFFYLKNVKYTAEMILNSKMLFQGMSAILFSAIACLLTVPAASAGCMVFMKGKMNSDREEN